MAVRYFYQLGKTGNKPNEYDFIYNNRSCKGYYNHAKEIYTVYTPEGKFIVKSGYNPEEENQIDYNKTRFGL
jgi:hypothetical protein